MTDFVTGILVIDTETTGMDPAVAEVVQTGVRQGLDVACRTRAWNTRPLNGIPPEATAVHGITNEMTVGWPTFAEIAHQVAEVVNSAQVIVGYNPDYDIRMLSSEFRRCGEHVTWPKTVICCKRLWDINRPRPPRDLTAAYKTFVSPEGFAGAHGAVADMAATARLCVAMLKEFQLTDVPWAEMDPERATWWGPSNHVVWKDGGLVCNFGKNTGKPYEEMEMGFIRWVSGQDFPEHVKMLGNYVISGKKRPTAAQLAFWARTAL